MFAFVMPSPGTNEQFAVMEVIGLTPNENYCLAFYYHMYGDDINQLVVIDYNELPHPELSRVGGT